MNYMLEVKSETDTTITLAGWGAVFDGNDLSNEYFTKDTDFWLSRLGPERPVLFDHGFDEVLSATVIGTGTLTPKSIDDMSGLWFEAQLDKSKQYSKLISQLAKAGVLGASSGAVSHLVKREDAVDGRVMIKSWPIAEMSLTVTPAEPRTIGIDRVKSAILDDVVTNESIKLTLDNIVKLLVEKQEEVALTVASYPHIEVLESMPLGEEDIKSVADKVSAKFDDKFGAMTESIGQILQIMQDTPKIKSSGIISDTGGLSDPEHKSFPDFLTAIARKDNRRLSGVYKASWERADGTKTALAEEAGAQGGYIVPPEYSSKLLMVAGEDAIVRPRAFVYPMAGRQAFLPVLDQTIASAAGVSAFHSGVVMNWLEEAGTLTETEPKFRQIELVAHKLGGYTLASSEVQADSAIALESLLIQLFGKSIAFQEDYAFLRGDGVGKPLGVCVAPCMIAVSRTGSGNDLDPADLGLMLRRLPPTSMKKAVWVMHPYLLTSLLQLNTTSQLNWITDFRSPFGATLMGLPVIFSEKMVVSGTALDVGLFDFSYYVIGDRQDITIAASEHYKFINDQMTWRVTKRVDGQPWLSAAIALQSSSSETVSPFVTLS